MLSFIGVRPGMTALDLSAGGGYTSELLAHAAGSNGRVYAQVAPRAGGAPPSFATLSDRAKTLRDGNIVPVLLPFDDLVAAEMETSGLEIPLSGLLSGVKGYSRAASLTLAASVGFVMTQDSSEESVRAQRAEPDRRGSWQVRCRLLEGR